MEFRACELVVLGFVVVTSAFYIIVAIGHCCIPAVACVVSDSLKAGGDRVTDASSTGEIL
jgi:hypothetical protein